MQISAQYTKEVFLAITEAYWHDVYHYNNNSFTFVLVWSSPEANSETRIWVPVVYLGGKGGSWGER